MKNQVISLYDYTGEALRPWSEAGYECYAYDIQHEDNTGGSIYYFHADLHDPQTLENILARHKNRVAFVSAFPPCTDLSGAGAVWWKKKAKANENFQQEATDHALDCSIMAREWDAPFYVENPVGALSRLWRKPDHIFNPCDYGGYLPEGDVHPRYPEIIPPRDAYRKKTCLWTGCGFKMPVPKPVDYVNVTCNRKDPQKGSNYSPVQAKTGGKSLKTKNIRSATPRGFARAVYEENAK